MGKVNSRNRVPIHICDDRDIIIAMSRAFIASTHMFNQSVAKMAGRPISTAEPGQIYIEFNERNNPIDMSYDLIDIRPPLTVEEKRELLLLRELQADPKRPLSQEEFDRMTELAAKLFNNAGSPHKENHECKYIKREGESCTLNNACKYPNCQS